MNKNRVALWTCLFVATLTTIASAEKIKIGYDKSVDFSKYKTYFLAQPGTPVTRPVLYDYVIGTIENVLKSKGFERTEGNGDLVLMGAGGIGLDINAQAGTPILPTYGGQPVAMDATVWTGALGSSVPLSAMYVPEGTLVLQFVDPQTNKVIWTGTVTEKLDLERKNDSLDRATKAVAKLIKQFPPKGSRK